MIDAFNEWLNSLFTDCSAVLERTRRRWKRLGKRRSLGTALNLFIAGASAVAAWFSYAASKNSADTAQLAQRFSEQVANAQINLARPRIAVLEGSITTFQRPRSWAMNSPETVYAIEIRIKNAGERIASPAWVEIRRGAFVHHTAILSTLAKDTEYPIKFETTHSLDRNEKWVIGFVLGDKVPTYSQNLI